MRTALVTGGAGFIGSHLCERLLDLGYKVLNLDNFNDFYNSEIKRDNILKAQSNASYEVIEGNILDEVVLDRIFSTHHIDAVFHLAALAGVRKSIINPLEYVDIDIKGTVGLLDFCKKYGVKKVIFASSSSVYGTNSIPFREEDCVNSPSSPYAVAKLAGELFCKTYHMLYKIRIVCLRFFTVYGPRQRPEMAIHYFTKQIFEGKEVLIYGDGSSSRDYTYIDDIINGIISSARLECDFEIFNLGNSSPVYLNDLVNIIEKKVGKTAKRRYLPIEKGDVENTYADISKAKRLLNYMPETGIELGVERFIKWYGK